MKKCRILLVEENKGATFAIVEMLKNKVEQFDWAKNVQELMQKYQSTHYDFILLNTWLEDSLEVIREIRAQESGFNGKFTPIIGLFADWEEDRSLRAAVYRKHLKAGMNDIFSQPLTEEDIDKILEKYIF